MRRRCGRCHRSDYGGFLSNEFLGTVNDVKGGELTAAIQEIATRGSMARDALSDQQLALLLDQIVGPGLEIPLPKYGYLHNYLTTVRIEGALGELSDGGVVADSDFGMVTKLKNKTSTLAGHTQTHRAEAGGEARVTGPLGKKAGSIAGGPKYVFSRTREHSLGVGRSGSYTHEHGPTLKSDGSIDKPKMVQFLASLDLKVTTTSVKVPNAAGNRTKPGKRGRQAPRPVDSEPTTRRVCRIMVPEHRVTRTKPQWTAAAKQESRKMKSPRLINDLRGGYPSRDLDGARIDVFTGSKALQGVVKETLSEASHDPIYHSIGGAISSTIADRLSPESIRGETQVFSRPLILDGLNHPRRVSDVHGQVGIQLLPKNPRQLPSAAAEYGRTKQSFAGSTTGKPGLVTYMTSGDAALNSSLPALPRAGGIKSNPPDCSSPGQTTYAQQSTGRS